MTDPLPADTAADTADDCSLPDRLAVLPARPLPLADIRLIAALPADDCPRREIRDCLRAFGWHWRSRPSRWHPPEGWIPE